MIESALTVQRVMQEARGQGQRLDRLSHVVYNVVMDKLEGVGFRFQRYDEIMNKVLMETDRRQQMCTSIGQFINEQNDIRKVVEELARCVDVMPDVLTLRRTGLIPEVFRLTATQQVNRIYQMPVSPCNWRSKI